MNTLTLKELSRLRYDDIPKVFPNKLDAAVATNRLKQLDNCILSAVMDDELNKLTQVLDGNPAR
jgi:hypothetical protein